MLEWAVAANLWLKKWEWNENMGPMGIQQAKKIAI